MGKDKDSWTDRAAGAGIATILTLLIEKTFQDPEVVGKILGPLGELIKSVGFNFGKIMDFLTKTFALHGVMLIISATLLAMIMTGAGAFTICKYIKANKGSIDTKKIEAE